VSLLHDSLDVPGASRLNIGPKFNRSSPHPFVDDFNQHPSNFIQLTVTFVILPALFQLLPISSKNMLTYPRLILSQYFKGKPVMIRVQELLGSARRGLPLTSDIGVSLPYSILPQLHSISCVPYFMALKNRQLVLRMSAISASSTVSECHKLTPFRDSTTGFCCDNRSPSTHD
jgi:hypothetical protein